MQTWGSFCRERQERVHMNTHGLRIQKLHIELGKEKAKSLQARFRSWWPVPVRDMEDANWFLSSVPAST